MAPRINQITDCLYELTRLLQR